MMGESSYIYRLISSLIIGLAGSVYLLGNRWVMGASVVIGGLDDGSGLGDLRDRTLFIADLVAALWLALLVLDVEAQTNITSNPSTLIAAGLLVGFEALTLAAGRYGLFRLNAWRHAARYPGETHPQISRVR